MKNLAALIMLLLLYSVSYCSTAGDSLAFGRKCKIVLYYGFQAEGEIVKRSDDTVKLQTDVTLLSIPVKDIKFVLNPDIELDDIEDTELSGSEEQPVLGVIQDTSDECDLYLDDKTVLNDVMIIAENDSTFRIVKDKRSKPVDVAGIRKIVFKSRTPFGTGYLIGSAIGFAVSFLTIYILAQGSGEVYQYIVYCSLGSIPFGIVGGVFGEIFSKDDVSIFNKGIYPAKLKKIRFLIDKHHN